MTSAAADTATPVKRRGRAAKDIHGSGKANAGFGSAMSENRNPAASANLDASREDHVGAGAEGGTAEERAGGTSLEVGKTDVNLFEKQFAFRGSETPSYIKRRAEDPLATPAEKAKRFRGYANEGEYRKLVPFHMQDGVKRLNQELLSFVNDPPGNVTAAPIEDNLYEWQGIMRGPQRTPYEGGVWFIRLQIPDTYPYKPPQVRFMNKIYHCNIDQDGAVCLNILKDDWTAALSIRSILLSISALLASPNPNDPLRQDAAQLLVADRAEHDKIALQCTLQFATGIEVDIPEPKNGPGATCNSLPEFRATSYADAGPDADLSGANSGGSCAKKEKDDEPSLASTSSSSFCSEPRSEADSQGPAREAESKTEKEKLIEQAVAEAKSIVSPEVLALQGGKTMLEMLLESAKPKQ